MGIAPNEKKLVPLVTGPRRAETRLSRDQAAAGHLIASWVKDAGGRMAAERRSGLSRKTLLRHEKDADSYNAHTLDGLQKLAPAGAWPKFEAILFPLVPDAVTADNAALAARRAELAHILRPRAEQERWVEAPSPDGANAALINSRDFGSIDFRELLAYVREKMPAPRRRKLPALSLWDRVLRQCAAAGEPDSFLIVWWNVLSPLLARSKTGKSAHHWTEYTVPAHPRVGQPFKFSAPLVAFIRLGVKRELELLRARSPLARAGAAVRASGQSVALVPRLTAETQQPPR